MTSSASGSRSPRLDEMARRPSDYPKLTTPALGRSLKSEFDAFVAAVVFDGEGTLPALFNESFTMVDANTAPLYGLETTLRDSGALRARPGAAQGRAHAGQHHGGDRLGHRPLQRPPGDARPDDQGAAALRRGRPAVGHQHHRGHEHGDEDPQLRRSSPRASTARAARKRHARSLAQPDRGAGADDRRGARRARSRGARRDQGRAAPPPRALGRHGRRRRPDRGPRQVAADEPQLRVGRRRALLPGRVDPARAAAHARADRRVDGRRHPARHRARGDARLAEPDPRPGERRLHLVLPRDAAARAAASSGST